MANLWQDVRYALRVLLKNPGFTAIAVLTLALGIGANSALFSVVNGVILNPLPFPRTEELTAIYWKTAQFGSSSIPFPTFLDWQKSNQTFSAMAAFREQDYSLTGTGEPGRLHGEMISAEFFPLLGIQPILGRGFRREEDQIGAARVVLLDEGLWKRKFGSSQDAIGKPLMLTGVSYTVIGVVPGKSPLFEARDIYVPIGQWNDPTFRDRNISMGTQSVGRMKSGVTLAQARADMDSIGRSLGEIYPESNKGTGVTVLPLKQDLVGDVTKTLYILLGAVGFVLLIACANVANLLLARSTGRTREFAIRVTLGAGHWRIVCQLLTESVLLAIAGGALGLAVAKWGTTAVLAALPEALPRSDNIHLDARVLLFTLGVSLLAGIVFGLAPALKIVRPHLSETLKEGGRGSSGARHRTQKIFVIGEMALSLVLLVGAGLMIRSLAALWSVKPGFDPHNVLTFNLGLSTQRLTTSEEIRAGLRSATAKFESMPGIEAASMMGGSLPMQGDSELPFWVEGRHKPANISETSYALWYAVETGYAKAMRIPVLRGRFISAQDTGKSQPVLVIDENFAREYFPNEDPLGKRINLMLLNVQTEVVGVVGHVKHWGLAGNGPQNLQSEFYFPVDQIPDRFLPLVAGGINALVRTEGPTKAFVGALRAASLQLDSDQVVYDFKPMEQIVSNSIGSQRFTMLLLGVFAALALVLSAVGIYGVISYLAGQRTHEIGIRMALGAQRKDVLQMVLDEGMRTALIGVGIGVAAALGLTRLMAKLIFGVGATDPLTFAGVAILLLLVALAACYVPARRAMHVDPIVALRYE